MPRGITLIGRSSECAVTLEDPLVSRQHARIVITQDSIVVENLRSRNGVKVNGTSIKDPTPLQDGDRIRIGTQELVFCVVKAQEPDSMRMAKSTGFLRHCAACSMPYPKEAPACPTCGGTEQMEEDTIGEFDGAASEAWGLKLMFEVIDKALGAGRVGDAVRLAHRAKAEVEQRLAGGMTLDGLAYIARVATQVTLAAGTSTWVVWSIRLHRELGVAPSEPTTAQWQEAFGRFRGEMVEPLDELLASCRTIGRTSSEMDEATGRLEGILRPTEETLAAKIVSSPPGT